MSAARIAARRRCNFPSPDAMDIREFPPIYRYTYGERSVIPVNTMTGPSKATSIPAVSNGFCGWPSETRFTGPLPEAFYLKPTESPFFSGCEVFTNRLPVELEWASQDTAMIERSASLRRKIEAARRHASAGVDLHANCRQ